MTNNEKDLSDKSVSLRDKISSNSHIYCRWKRGDIYDEIKNKVNREDYNRNIGDVAIVQEKKQIEGKSLLDNCTYENTGKYYIIVESSRGSSLYKKHIPKYILPLFDDILDKATATGKYRLYSVIKY